MNDLKYTKEELDLLCELCSNKVEKLAWDLNAFYFNLKDYAIKLESLSDLPEGSNYEYDEFYFTRITKQNKKYEFNNNEPEKWYKIIGENIEILEIQIASFCIKYPEEKLIDADSLNEVENGNGFNFVNSGIIIKTKKGYVPALLMENNFGFDWGNKCEFFSEGEIKILKQKDLKKTKFEPFHCK